MYHIIPDTHSKQERTGIHNFVIKILILIHIWHFLRIARSSGFIRENNNLYEILNYLLLKRKNLCKICSS